jgi:Ser/Thr protein kinase RdoA (MazF antagonist)
MLRRWPHEHPSPERLQRIHDVQNHAAQRLSAVPTPLHTLSGATFVEDGDRLWELVAFKPGEPHTASPADPSLVELALESLAKFHLATSDFEVAGRATPGFSAGMQARLDFLRHHQAGGLDALLDDLRAEVWPAGVAPCRTLAQKFRELSPAEEPRLAVLANLKAAQQYCLCDIHCDHVLFTARRVTGLIDFGAVRRETVARDIGRLLGSYARGDGDLWRAGIAAYARVRPLSAEERELAEGFDRANALMAGINWMRWIYLERRAFGDADRVLDRLHSFVCRLDRWK